MTTQEFKAIVDDAVKNGANRTEAENYVRLGYNLDADFGKTAKAVTAKKPAAKNPTKNVRK